jgi:hypothetical protein
MNETTNGRTIVDVLDRLVDVVDGTIVVVVVVVVVLRFLHVFSSLLTRPIVQTNESFQIPIVEQTYLVRFVHTGDQQYLQ